MGECEADVERVTAELEAAVGMLGDEESERNAQWVDLFEIDAFNSETRTSFP